ncbi:MAG: archease [Candidatus Nanohaloarchaea archaeon]
MSYEILEHAADEKFRASGEDLEEVFSEVVHAFSEIVGGAGGMYRHQVEVESEGLEALLFDFLDRLIYLQDTENVAVGNVKDLAVEETGSGYRLEATVLVDNITSGMSLLDIKGPTYNEMKVDYGDGVWTLEAVLDI